MESTESIPPALRFDGLDGANPLGFLALLGTMCLASRFAPGVRASWAACAQGWRPLLLGCQRPRATFAADLAAEFIRTGNAPFDVDPRLPFDRALLRRVMLEASRGNASSRRTADLLAGFGSDAFAGDAGTFSGTALRLVRAGDSYGQGLPHYVVAARQGLNAKALEAALFDAWRYEDDCFSLRWDPIEDQRHALRANDPSNRANKRAGSRGVKAANALAAEALSILPVLPQQRDVATTGFATFGRHMVAFTWPIWDRPCGIDVVRSILADPELCRPEPNRRHLAARGIPQVFRSERLASGDYYKNFGPALPV